MREKAKLKAIEEIPLEEPKSQVEVEGKLVISHDSCWLETNTLVQTISQLYSSIYLFYLRAKICNANFRKRYQKISGES